VSQMRNAETRKLHAPLPNPLCGDEATEDNGKISKRIDRFY